MSEKMIENNKVSVIGEVVSEFTFKPRSIRGRILYRRPGSQPSERSGDVIPPHDFRTASGCIERLPRNDDGGDRPVPFLQPS